MAMTAESLVSDLFYGFDTEQLFLRLDTRGGPFREQLGELEQLRVTFLEPEGFELAIARPGSAEPLARLYHDGVPVTDAGVRVVADRLFELAVPFRSLAVKTGDRLQFCVELLEDDQPVERIPSEGAVESEVPSADFELVMWQA
jgi:hypothetical protein